MNQVISDNIIKLRKEKGLTQIDLAKAINYSDKVISKWERAESLPNVEALLTLSEYFNVTSDYLLGKEETTQSTLISKKLDVKVEGTPSLFFRLSVFIPLVIWIIMSILGLQFFIVGALLFLVYWTIYCATQLNGTFTTIYEDHEIKVTVSVKSIKMYINNQLVDSTGVPLIMNYKLSGIVGKRRYKAKVSIFLFSKCEMYVE